MVPNFLKMFLTLPLTRTSPRSFQTDLRSNFVSTVHPKKSRWGTLKISSSLFWKQGPAKQANRWKLFAKELTLSCRVIARYLATWTGKVSRLGHVAKKFLTQRSSDQSRLSLIVLTIIRSLGVFGEPLSLSVKSKKPRTLSLHGAEPDSLSTAQAWITNTRSDW